MFIHAERATCSLRVSLFTLKENDTLLVVLLCAAAAAAVGVGRQTDRKKDVRIPRNSFEQPVAVVRPVADSIPTRIFFFFFFFVFVGPRREPWMPLARALHSL